MKQSAVQADRMMPARPKSMIDHSEYVKAHDKYAKMTAAKLKAHDVAMSHVRRGLAAASPTQLADEDGY